MNTNYTVRVKKTDVAFEFKYNLEGDLVSYKVLRGRLDAKQAKWLFTERFPAFEAMMKHSWMQDPKIKSNFEIEVGELDLSFDTFYDTYNHKIKKVKAKAVWDKLNKADKLEALKGIKAYDGYLKRKGVAKANPQAYLNQRYWEDDYNSIH